MGLMTSIVSIGTVILQSAINQLGTTIISAQVAARRIMSFAVLPITAIASSITTFISQILGLGLSWLLLFYSSQVRL